MLTQRDARVIELLPEIKVPSLVVSARRRTVPRSLRLHGGENSGGEKGGDPGSRPRRQHRPAAGLYRRRVAVPR